jgi:hypothetical protein
LFAAEMMSLHREYLPHRVALVLNTSRAELGTSLFAGVQVFNQNERIVYGRTVLFNGPVTPEGEPFQLTAWYPKDEPQQVRAKVTDFIFADAPLTVPVFKIPLTVSASKRAWWITFAYFQTSSGVHSYERPSLSWIRSEYRTWCRTSGDGVREPSLGQGSLRRRGRTHWRHLPRHDRWQALRRARCRVGRLDSILRNFEETPRLPAGQGTETLVCRGLVLEFVTRKGTFSAPGRYRIADVVSNRDPGIVTMDLTSSQITEGRWPFAFTGVHLEGREGYLQLDEMTESSARGTFRAMMRRQPNGE